MCKTGEQKINRAEFFCEVYREMGAEALAALSPADLEKRKQVNIHVLKKSNAASY